MRNDIPNFNLLAVFAAVMEHGSFSRAADYMDTNSGQVTVYQYISGTNTWDKLGNDIYGYESTRLSISIRSVGITQ